tara:strand:+ start:98 stop:634 length:537 start_codon:yes stop_codon:yes gene_type:complete
MSDIFEKLDADISLKKEDKEKKEQEINSFWKKIDKFYNEVFNKNFKGDYQKLEKLVSKHINTKVDAIKYSNNVYLDHKLEFVVEHSGPDNTFTEAVSIKMMDKKSLSTLAKIDHLKKYKFEEENFALEVSHLGEEDHDSMLSDRPTIQSKIFDLKKKEDAYKYFVDLCNKNILQIDNN